MKGTNKAIYKKFPTSQQAWEFVGLENPNKEDNANDSPVAFVLSESLEDEPVKRQYRSSRGDSEPNKPSTAYAASPATTPSNANRCSDPMNTSGSYTTPPNNPSSTSGSPATFEAIGMLRATAKALRSTAEQLLSSIDSLSSQIEQVASSVHLRTNSSPTFVAEFGKAESVKDHLKRSYSECTALGGSAPESEAKKRQKKSPDVSNCGFTGTPFPDDEGVPVFTDGASFHNGRATARAGIGVYWDQNSPFNVSERLSGKQTNNRAEIHAAKVAVQQAKRMGINRLIVHTDSEFLINGITKWIKKWKKNGWKLVNGGEVINREDFEALDAAVQDISVKWVHVRGHTGIEGNELADQLANEGAKKPLSA